MGSLGGVYEQMCIVFEEEISPYAVFVEAALGEYLPDAKGVGLWEGALQMNNQNQRTLNSFVTYCSMHPEQRFWQALRNWSGFSFVIGIEPGRGSLMYDMLKIGGEDTYHREGK
jgi:hypothetical protein